MHRGPADAGQRASRPRANSLTRVVAVMLCVVVPALGAQQQGAPTVHAGISIAFRSDGASQSTVSQGVGIAFRNDGTSQTTVSQGVSVSFRNEGTSQASVSQGVSVSFRQEGSQEATVSQGVGIAFRHDGHGRDIVSQGVSVSFRREASGYARDSLTIGFTQVPVITWPAPAAIPFGTALSAAQLNATTTVPGAFAYTPPGGTVLPAGTGQTLSVTFTPADTVHYESVTRTVTIDVLRPTPLGCGSPVDGSIVESGQQRLYTFGATAGQAVTISLSTTTRVDAGYSAVADVYAPGGVVWRSALTGRTEVGPLPADGTYWVIVRDHGAALTPGPGRGAFALHVHGDACPGGVVTPTVTRLVDYVAREVGGSGPVSLQYRDTAGAYFDLEPLASFDFGVPGAPSTLPRVFVEDFLNGTIHALPAEVERAGARRAAVIRVGLNGAFGSVRVWGEAGRDSGTVGFAIYKGSGGHVSPLWQAANSGVFDLTVPYADGDPLYFVVDAAGSDVNDWSFWRNVRFQGMGPSARIISPVRSGAIAAGDVLRLASVVSGENQYGPYRFTWRLGELRESTLQSPGMVAFPLAATTSISLDVIDSMGAVRAATGGRAVTVVEPGGDLPDLAAVRLDVTGGLTVSEARDISYTVRNIGAVPLTATWVDAIYLSTDEYLDSDDLRLAAVPVSTTVAAGGSYTNTIAVTMPVVAEGAYYLLLSVDDEWHVLEERQLNNEHAVATDLMVASLRNGVAETGSYAGNASARYYRIDVPGGQNLWVGLHGVSGQGTSELYLRVGALPTRGVFDARSAEPGTPHQQVLVAAATAGTWYALAYGESVPGDGAFRIEARTGSVNLTRVTPAQSASGGPATLTVTGAGFGADTTAVLIDADGHEYAVGALAVDSYTSLTITTDLSGVPAGLYSLRVTTPSGSATLGDVFEVLPSGDAKLETNVVAPSSVGYHANATIYVEYRNAGTVAMPAPLLILTATQNGQPGAFLTLDPTRVVPGFWTSAIPDGFAHSVQILASGEQPGVLQPGESYRVPVWYAGWKTPWDFTYPPIKFALGVIKASDTTPADWTALEGGMRPPTIGAEAWDALWASFVAQVGTTWGHYVTRLDENAAYLGRLGRRVVDVGELLAFQFLQADGLSPLNTLAGGVDATVEAPGMPVVFSRSFGHTITSRFQDSPIGRGWSHNWQYALAKGADGTVIVTGPGGSRRTFQPDSRNSSYFAQPGDQGRLSMIAGGAYRLQEKGGLVRAFRDDGRLDFVEDPNGNRVSASYGGDHLTALTHSSGAVLSIVYSGDRIASVTDHLGRRTEFSYDAAGHLVSARGFDGRTTVYGYGAGSVPALGHALSEIVLPNGSHQYFTYDAAGRLSGKARDGQTEAVVFGAGPNGRVTATNALGHTSRFYFDHRGLVARTEDPLGNAVHLEFDGQFNLTRLTDPSGHAYAYSYDSRGNMVRGVDPLGHETRFTYAGSLSRLATVMDARGNVTRYAHDARGNLQSLTYADGSREVWIPDAAGQTTSWTNRRGATLTYTYDAAGRLTGKTHADGSRAAYAYDARGNLVAAATTNAASATVTSAVMTYDAHDRLTRVADAAGRFLAFTYDAAGRRLSSVDQLGYRLDYRYDAAGRLETITDETATEVVRHTYDVAGRLVRKVAGNGLTTTYDYDAAGRLSALTNALGTGAVVSRFAYTYDTRGRRIAMSTLDGAWTYMYDDIGQLTRAVFASSTPNLASQDLTYVYDAVGNRIRTIENGVTREYTTNALNQYTRVGETEYVFDADGNLVSETGPGGTTTYTYSDENRLIGVTKGADTWGYVYDALGQRVATTANGVTTSFVTDPIGLGNVVGEYDATGGLVAHYVHGFGLLSRAAPGGSPAYYAFDAVGNVQQLVTAAGLVANRYAYAPFGEAIGRAETFANPFQFNGQFGVVREANGLDNMRARHLVSARGRFLQRDPAGRIGGSNLYGFCGNAPLTYADPLGLEFDLVDYVARHVVVYGNWYGKYNSGGNRNTATGTLGDLSVGWVDLADRGAKIHDILVYMGIPGAANRVSEWLNRRVHEYASTGRDLSDSEDEMIEWFQIGAAFDMLDDNLTPGRWKTLPASELKAILDALREAIGHSDELYQAISRIAASTDPNAKSGPSGFGVAAYLSPNGAFAYRVDFENERNASAPAQQVVVTDQLSANLDFSTLQFTEVGFGDRIIAVPPRSQHFETTLSMTFNEATFDVQIELDLRAWSGQIVATFRSVDPETGLPPAVEIGFLPQEDGTGRGRGHFSYTIAPKAGLANGAETRNVALISFDNAPTISTDQVDPHDPSKGVDPAKQCLITVDGTAPASAVAALPGRSPRTFTVSWSGSDAYGAGVTGYDVYVSKDGQPYTAWVSGTAATSGTFAGEAGATYRFYSVALDGAGNREPAPAGADTETTTVAPPVFTDDPLTARTTPVKAVHVAELRSAIDQLRSARQLPVLAWTDPMLAAGTTTVRATHLTELRAALTEVYVAAGLTPPTFADETITARSTVIASAHVAELRAAILAIW